MGRIEQLRVVDPVLTELARGYSNKTFAAELIMPVVPVDKEAGKVPSFGADEFLIYNTERALRAKSNFISPETRSTIDFVCDEHDISYPIDYREEQEDIFPLQQYATVRVTKAIQLRREKIVADLLTTAGTYPTGNKVALSGSTQWTHADSNPIDTVETAKEAVKAKTGVTPNVMIIGASAWKTLKNHDVLMERIKYSMKGVLTLELVKELLGMQTIVIGEAISMTDAGVKSYVWGDNAVLAYIPTAGERNIYEPSFGYTLRKKGNPTVDTFMGEGNKIQYVRNTDIFVPKVLGADAGYLIADINA